MRRQPEALVISDVARAGADTDWSAWCVSDEDDVAQGTEHGQIVYAALSSLRELARERAEHPAWRSVLIASDQFFAWVPEQPRVRVSPDVYLLDDPPPRPHPNSWQTWLPGHHPPRFAIEVVSPKLLAKDYDIVPHKYAQLGTRELVIADWEAAAGRVDTGRADREAIQVYRRLPDGAFGRVACGDGPAQCREIDAHVLFVAGPDNAWQLRLSRDAHGRDLVPTTAERARAAEARVRELEALLDRDD